MTLGDLQPLIDDLLAAKSKFEALTGTPFDPPKSDVTPLHFWESRKVDIRLPGKGDAKLPWREAGPLNHLDDIVDSDQ